MTNITKITYYDMSWLKKTLNLLFFCILSQVYNECDEKLDVFSWNRLKYFIMRAFFS